MSYKKLIDHAERKFNESGLNQISQQLPKIGYSIYEIDNKKYAIALCNERTQEEYVCWSKSEIDSVINSLIKKLLAQGDIIKFDASLFKTIINEKNPNDNWGSSSYATINGIDYYHPFHYGNQIECHKFAYKVKQYE